MALPQSRGDDQYGALAWTYEAGMTVAVGAVRNNDFADDSAQMIRFSDTNHTMLLAHERFTSFTPRMIPNAHETAQAFLALSVVNRDNVDAMVEKVPAAGGTEPNPIQDHGFIYGRNFADLDGHSGWTWGP